MLSGIPIPGLFITGTGNGVGKTTIAAAIAHWFHQHGRRVAACKPVATGCPHRREGLVSPDAEILAHHGDVRFPLDIICPLRYAEPLLPALAAERAQRPLDWTAVDRSLQIMARDSDVMIVEGIGGLMTPLEPQRTVLDLAKALGLPAVLVARPDPDSITHTLTAVQALRHTGVRPAGVVTNRYPAESPSISEEAAPRMIEKWTKVPILCIVPDTPFTPPHLPADILAAIGQVDWLGLSTRGAY